MKIFGKNIRLFLMDGTPNGRWICELSNWTGIAYKIPRNRVKECKERNELTSPGIYFLFGKDDVDGEPLIYIGEAEDILYRLKQQIDSKEFWNEVILFISKDDNLNKAHIKYLENRFHSIAKECNRYKVDNSCTPTRSAVSEAEQAQLEEFIYNAKILVNILGHKVFEPMVDEYESDDNKEQCFYLKVGGLKAKGMVTADGFVVFKGSTIHRDTCYSSITSSARQRIEQYKSEGKVIDSVLQEDVLFSSPSAAAVFVLGYSVSGPQTWKNSKGKSLKEIEKVKY